MKISFTLFGLALGHGRLIEPPGRSSYHHFTNDPTIDQSRVVPNYNDNELFCGGFQTQVSNGYRCGVCGDDVNQARPRENELGGKYGRTGLIPRTYNQAEPVDITVQLTAHHKGWISFKICKINSGEITENEACFDLADSAVSLKNGIKKWDVTDESADTYYRNTLILPDDLKCDHCVLQWRYHAGNSWGCNEDGKCGVGMGYQEEFYGCADIKIVGRDGARPTTGSTTKETTIKPVTEKTTTTTTYPGDIQVDIKLFCNGKETGIYSHPTNCEKFIQCSNGYTYVQECPSGTLFNSSHLYCDWPENVTC